MTTLATAAVDIVANIDGFEDDLRRQLNQAGAGADRAAQQTGRRLGTSIQSGISSTATRTGQAISAVGRSAQSALSPALDSLGRFQDGFRDAGAAASAFSGRMGTMGGATRRALDPALGHLGRFRDGFNSAESAASAFSGRMGSLGGVAAATVGSIQSGFGSLRSGFDRVTASTRETWKSFGEGESALATLGETAKGVFAGFAAFTLAETAMVAVDEFFRGSVAAFGDFEAGMNAAFTLLPGISQQAMGEMTEQVLAFAKEANTIPEEIVPALYSALGAGVPQDTVFDFLDTANKAAIAGVADLQTSVDGLTSVVNTYGADVISVNEVSDQVFTLMRLGKTTFDEVASSISNVAPVASDFGVAFGDVAASMATLTALGTPTSESTTQIRAAISELGQSGTEASKVFEKTAGTTFPKFIREGGNFEEALQVMAQAADDSGKSVLDLFGSIEAGSAVASLTGRAGSVKFAEAMQEMSTSAGATEVAFETMNRGINVSLKRLQVAVSSASIELGERLGPVVARGVDMATAAMERFPEVLERIGSTMQSTGAADSVRNIFSGTTDVLMALRPLVEGFITGVAGVGVGLAKLVGFIAPAGDALSGFASWVERTETLLRVLGVALGSIAAAMAVHRAATLALSTSRTVVIGTVRALNTLLGITRAWTLVAGAAATANRVFAASFRLIGIAIRSIPVIGWIIGLIGLLIGAITLLWQRSETFRRIVTDAWSQVQDVVGAAVENVMVFVDRLRQGWDDLMSSASDSTFWSGAWANIVSTVQTAGTAITTVIDQIRATFGFLGDLVRGEADFGTFVSESIDRFRELGEAITEHIIGSLQRLPGMAAEAVGALTSRIVTALTSLPSQIASMLGSIDIMGWLSTASTQAVEYLSGVGTTVVDYIKSIPDRVSSAIDPGAIWEWLKNAGSRITEFMADYGPQLLRGLGIAIGVAVLGAPALVLGLAAAILGTLGFVAWELLKWAGSAFGDMMVAAGHAIRDKASDLGQWFADLPSLAAEHLADLGQTIVEFFASIPDRVAALVGADDGLLRWMRDLPGQAAEYLTDLGQTIAHGLIGRIEAIPGQIRSAVGADDGLLGWMRDLPGQARERLTALGSTIADYLTSLPGRMRDAVSGDGGILDWLREAPSLAVQYLRELGVTIVDYIKGLPGRVRDAVSGDGGFLDWLQEAPARAASYLSGLGSTIVDYIKGLPGRISSAIDPGAIWEWLKNAGSRITEFMADYGPQILKGLAVAIGVAVLGVPALLLGLLAAIVYVLGVIAWELGQWAWGAFTDMMVTAGQAVGAGISSVVAWFQSLPGRVLESLAAFGSQLYTWGTSALASLRGAFSSGLSSLTGLWSTTWTTLRTSASTALTTLVSWAATQAANLRDRVMGPVNTLKDRLIGAFESAREGIGEAWQQLRSTVGKPIEWVVNTGYNDWLRGVWGKVVDKFGGPSLPSYTVAFAKGGIFPGNGGGVFSGYTPGKDVHAMPMAAFSGGESVLRPEVTKAWGAGTTLMLNKLARTGGVKAVRRALAMLMGGQNPFTGMSVPRTNPAAAGAGGGFTQRFAQGGILGSVTGSMASIARWLNSAKEDFSDAMLDFLDDPGGMLRKLLEQVMDYTKMPDWGTTWTSQLAKVPKGIIDALVKQASNLFSVDGMGDWINMGGSAGGRLGAALRFAKAQHGKPYIWGGAGPRGYDCTGFLGSIMNVILGQNPYSRRFSTHSFVGSSANGFRRNFPSPFTIGVTHAGVGHAAGTLLRTNVESRGSVGAVVGSRARGTTNSLFTSRWGMTGVGGGKSSARLGGEGILYDGGGTLWPGTHLVSNKTGRPESIRTYAQEERVSRLVRTVERQTAQVARTPLVPVDQVGALERALGIRDRRDRGEERARVYAPITVNSQASDPNQVAHKVVDRLVTKAGV
ncbi:phage tail tape measure protein [Nocardiopsis alba]|uniref:phage tail tape measure protein n=1 Tax=Nocardiopsis alba TaxID=53437 RepID=UPI003F4CAB1C